MADADGQAEAVLRLHRLASSQGAAEAAFAAADHLPELSTGHTLYAFGTALALVLGDAADQLDEVVDTLDEGAGQPDEAAGQ